MAIEDQILGIIKTQSRISGIDSEIREVEIEISDYYSKLSQVNESKEELIRDKKEAELDLKDASKDVEDAKANVSAAQKSLRMTQGVESKAREVLESFSEDKFIEADRKIDEIKNVIAVSEKKKDTASKERGVLDADLEKLQAELKRKGYNLSFNQPSGTPTTTYL